MKLAVLVKDSSFDINKIQEFYLNPINQILLDKNVSVYSYSLSYDKPKKPSTKHIKEYLEVNKDSLSDMDIIYCTDANYFKVLTKETNTNNSFGYLKKSSYFPKAKIILGINYKQLLYTDSVKDKLYLSLDALKSVITGTSLNIGTNILKNICYPKTNNEIFTELKKLLDTEYLTCDIETTGLYPHTNQILTIAFATDKHSGIAFKFDKKILKDFFEAYQGTLIFHNATFDIKNLIYHLYMKHSKDWEGLIYGLEVFNKVHDTQIISYLNLNSCENISLSLKQLAYNYTGDYAVDNIANPSIILIQELLEYNLIDCCATWYVFDKYYPRLAKENQLKVYENLFQKQIKLITHMELSGLPMIPNKITEVEQKLCLIRDTSLNFLNNHNYTINALNIIKQQELHKKNSKLKTKQHTIDIFDDLEFNFNSPSQLAILLFDVMKFEPISFTPTKQPQTDINALESFYQNTSSDEKKEYLHELLNYVGVKNIINTFIPVFKNGIQIRDRKYLFGSFNITGTKSGRLSSSKPNLQQIPSTSIHGKLVKSIFAATTGEIFCGADFHALEDIINTLLTKDPNKIKIYIDNYDGHCLRAYNYFPEKMQDITEKINKPLYQIGDSYFEGSQEVVCGGKTYTIEELLNEK